MTFFQKGLVFSSLFVQLPRRDCFLPVFSVRHEEVFVERSNSTTGSKRWIAKPPGPLCFWPNNMMGREKHQEQATENILIPADEPQASSQRSSCVH
ncbi:hypothetical protein KUCAC02_027531 [Chaenocephalus aceratus]|uniref:Uncharacterized protein n=1 Tax=Chaenocephalus aceratus TaxID=36190 RepID=A0ACB9W4A0_CHAAC|nr:hypothetical protein KUCAC02_027531 [Chaenocephalus aceratus]